MRRDTGSPEADAVISDSQRFSPHEDDEETLHEVIEITGERDGRYKVRWEGVNPDTMKPWPQSWVPKKDCTDDLVLEWKRKKREKERRRTYGRDSTASKRTSRSVVSTARTKSRSESMATSSKAEKRRTERSPAAGPSNLNTSKHRFEEVVKEEAELEGTEDQRQPLSPTVAISSRMRPTDDSMPLPTVAQPKGKKRKLAEAQSAASSANLTSRLHIDAVPIEVDSDDETTRVGEVVISRPPRKKRKVIKESDAPAEVTKHTAHNEEDLPDAYQSPGMNDSNDGSRNDNLEKDLQNDNLDGGKQQTKDNGKRELGYVVDEDSEVEIIELSHQPRQPTQKSNPTSAVPDKPLRKPFPRMVAPPRPPRSKQAVSSAGVPISGSRAVDTARPVVATSPKPLKKPIARMVAQRWPRSKQTVSSAGVPISGSRAVDTARPVVATRNSNDSMQSSSSPHRSLSEARPPFERDQRGRYRKPPPAKLTTKPPRNEGLDVVSAHNSDVPLSPRALQRLRIFDMEVMEENTQAVEEKRTNEINGGGGQASTLKRPNTSGNNRPLTSTLRPTLQFGTPSYLVDVVPETEVENSQEDKPRSPPIAAENRIAGLSPIGTSAAGPSIIKSLRPLPHISPSAFHPHLQPPNSSVPESIVEPFSSLERPAEDEAIEQFDSPDKLHSNKKVVVLNKNAVDIPDIVRRGQEIAEQAEALRRRVSASSEAHAPLETMKKKSVEEVIARAQSRSRSESIASRLDENHDERLQPEEEDVADASTSVVPPASGPGAFSQDQRPLADDTVGMDVDDPDEVDQTHDDIAEPTVGINPELLRQEEEESSQDLVAELRERQEKTREANAGKLGLPSVSVPSPRPPLMHGDAGTRNALVSVEESKLASRPSSPRVLQNGNQPDDAGRGPITRSRSKTPSVVTNGRTNVRGKKKALSIPSPVPSRRESAEPECQKSPVDVFQNAQGASATSSILAAEISSLQTQVNEKQLKIDSLQQGLDSLREQLRISEDRKALLEADRERQTELQTQWSNEKLVWEAERTQLAAQNAASEKSKIQAEQDREFMREQYAKASAYVTTVREENRQLEERAMIAEGQAKTGVELIKATFESRVATLQDEVKAWRRMAEFVMEKDCRTNDEIRRRAAEEPELRVLCVRQKESLEEALAKIEGLEAEVQEKSIQNDASKEELENCQKENARLHFDLNEAMIKLDRLGRSGDESPSQEDGHEFVYQCLWRVDDHHSCPEAFTTMRDLEQHLYSGHLSAE